MDEQDVMDQLAASFYQGWEVVSTGGGFLVITDWTLPAGERIEIHVRRVGEREDLFLVTDGGEIINFLFSQGVDISRDKESRDLLDGIAEKYGVQVAAYQMAKSAGETEVAGVVRTMLEAIKEASFMLCRKIATKHGDSVH